MRAREIHLPGLLPVGLSVLLFAACVFRNPGMVSGPRFAEPSRLEVGAEAIDVDCRDSKEMLCDYDAHYVLSNPSADEVEQTAVVISQFVSDLTVRIDGKKVELIADSPLPLEAIRSAAEKNKEQLCQGPPQPFDYRAMPVQCWEPCENAGENTPHVWREICECPSVPLSNAGCVQDPLIGWLQKDKADALGFSVNVGAGQTRWLRISGRLALGKESERRLDVPAAFLRHPLTTKGSVPKRCDGPRCTLEMDYLPTINSRSEDYVMEFKVRWPEGWEVDGGMARQEDPQQPVEDFDRERRLGVDRVQRAARLSSEGLSPSQLTTRFGYQPPKFHPGGPVAGIGLLVDRNDVQHLRASVGYELAYPSWLFYSLNLESDFEELFMITPVAQVAFPGLFGVFPSLSLGVGVPMPLKPTPTAGARVQMGFQWPLIGLQLAFDYVPAQAEMTGARILATLSL